MSKKSQSRVSMFEEHELDESSESIAMASDDGLESDGIPEEALAPIMAAQIDEEFRELLLTIVLSPQP